MEIILIKPFYVVKKTMEGNCRQKSMYLAFILTFFILDAWLYVYMHVSCFHSYSNFILYSCLYVNVYITLWLFYTLLFLLYFNLFLMLCYFFNFEVLCFDFICVIPSSCILLLPVYTNHISIWSIPSTNHQSTNTKHEAESMKTNTSCMNLVLYYDVRRRYNRYNCCSR